MEILKRVGDVVFNMYSQYVHKTVTLCFLYTTFTLFQYHISLFISNNASKSHILVYSSSGMPISRSFLGNEDHLFENSNL
jgi:hypothetical protein